MSYQVLARKWRPKTFGELVGQEHVLKALTNALENRRLHHAYLFAGTRGVGKTTIARILARSLNCETGVTASPCGACSACQEINEGRFVDLIEVDAASRTKVEDTRDLLENIQYRPARGRYKIYLIDEVHMLSTHSFNALLKTLEEPPEHVKFLLATTDPQKLPMTVLSRCLQFNLKNLTASRIQEHLKFVLNEEKVSAEPEALWHLSRAARGSMRDALSLTDQAICHGGGKLSEADVVVMLGTVDRKRIYELVDGLAAGDAQKVLAIAGSLAEFSPDYFALVEDMLVLAHAIAVYQRVPEAQKSEGFEAEKLSAYAQSFSPEDVQVIYQMLLMGSKDLKVTPDLQMGFEMLLLRLIAFQPARPGEVLIDEGTPEKKPEVASADDRYLPADVDSDTGDQGVAKHSEKNSRGARESASTGLIEPIEEKSSESGIVRRAKKNEQANGDMAEDRAPADDPATLKAADFSPDEAVAPANGQDDAATEWTETTSGTQSFAENKADATGGEGPASKADLPEPDLYAWFDEDAGDVPQKLTDLNTENWIALFRNLPLTGVVKTLCAHLVVVENSDRGLLLNLAGPGQKVFEQSHHDKLDQALADYFNEPVQTLINTGSVDRETPAEYAERRHREKLVEAEKSILQSPVVQRLVEEFAAELVPGSVRLNMPDRRAG